eukprot:1162063-Pelagomonas_calceolata.AAC.2
MVCKVQSLQTLSTCWAAAVAGWARGWYLGSIKVQRVYPYLEQDMTHNDSVRTAFVSGRGAITSLGKTLECMSSIFSYLLLAKEDKRHTAGTSTAPAPSLYITSFPGLENALQTQVDHVLPPHIGYSAV